MVHINFEETLNTEEEFITKKLEKWARETGDRTFVYYGEENKTYTFKEYNEIVNSIAHNLIKMGIQKGDRISLFLKNPLISSLVMFGIWKAGAVYCPINFNYKGKLLSYQINDTKPKMLITERPMVHLINDIKSDLPSLDVIIHNPESGEHDYEPEAVNTQLDAKFTEYSLKSLTKGNTSNPGIDLKYWDIANIVYTSGTTGPAKGVVQSYRWMHAYTFLFRCFTTQDDVIYNDLPFYHVGGAFALFARGAFAGCTVAMWDKFSPNRFWERIKVSGSTSAILLSVMIPWLMKAEPSENDRKNTLTKVYMQPLPDYHHKVAKRFGFDFVYSGYGQTEAGNGFISIIDELEEGEGTPPELYKGYSREETLNIARRLKADIKTGKDTLARGFMGVSAPFLEARIVNKHDEECEPNEAGQIVFRSRFPHLMLEEYFNNPDATLEVFQNLWFHTGDVGYKDKNGIYYFVDRMKDVIRVKGENISSYQIEDIINQHEGVSVCAAFPVPAKEGNEDDIVVYVVRQNPQLQENDLREWTKVEMPKFMWPKYIRFIDEIPRTPTNKIEKYKLKTTFLEELQTQK
jgi:carnitine-CoA ligase